MAKVEFYALILLSAMTGDDHLRREVMPKIHDALKREHLSFERAGFGTWQVVQGVLAKRLRIMRDDTKTGGREWVEALLKTCDEATLGMLLCKELPSIFQTANRYRNNWTGHGGVADEAEAKRRHDALREELVRFREATGDGWNHYQLVLPGKMRFRKNRYVSELRRVMGNATPFEQFEAVVSTSMEEGFLHLLATEESEALRLLLLVRVMPSPNTAANACYFFSRREKGASRFVSYHFEQKADVRQAFPEVDAALALLAQDQVPTV